ncbi:MAG: 23S rRNA (uracil(1939)-C(5))-methyltransferase RlmD [Acidobacteria bacterium]|nr:23S rRNA (uracil(1939)-C(5))-methyltransferase RlmD [Acidobacteriota bacterium]MBV9624921.1 23S rRNA (uracil(1939)-C(5))-methyltransferase RlmD [Acidobacteriota bacterium]
MEKLVYGGDGLARLRTNQPGPGKSVFVPFVLPGERVEARSIEEKPGFVRARLESIGAASPERIGPGCPYFGRCGGCHYQHARYERQIAIKTAILKETLRRTAKLELPCELGIHHAAEWEYRNRTRLKVQSSPVFALGYYEFRSHRLLPVEECPISSPLINRAIQAMWSVGRSAGFPTEITEIELFANHSDSALLVSAYCRQGTRRRDARPLVGRLIQLVPEITGVALFAEALPGRPKDGNRLASSEDPQLVYQTRRSSYRVGAASFFQVNRFLIDELIEVVTGGASGGLALDLYAGVGLFSTVLARSFQRVVAVEASSAALADLRHNAGDKVVAVQATTAEYLGKVSLHRPDLVVIDPPRAGVGEKIVHSLARLAPAAIRYVSCDPATLARDLRFLVDRGYRIEEGHFIDLFPQSYHIESVFHLCR